MAGRPHRAAVAVLNSALRGQRLPRGAFLKACSVLAYGRARANPENLIDLATFTTGAAYRPFLLKLATRALPKGSSVGDQEDFIASLGLKLFVDTTTPDRHGNPVLALLPVEQWKKLSTLRASFVSRARVGPPSHAGDPEDDYDYDSDDEPFELHEARQVGQVLPTQLDDPALGLHPAQISVSEEALVLPEDLLYAKGRERKFWDFLLKADQQTLLALLLRYANLMNAIIDNGVDSAKAMKLQAEDLRRQARDDAASEAYRTRLEEDATELETRASRLKRRAKQLDEMLASAEQDLLRARRGAKKVSLYEGGGLVGWDPADIVKAFPGISPAFLEIVDLQVKRFFPPSLRTAAEERKNPSRQRRPRRRRRSRSSRASWNSR